MLVPGLVNSATSHAVNRHIDTLKGVKTRDSIKDAKIAQADFERALQDITPAFGTSENAFEGFPDKDIIMYSEHVQVRSRAPGAVTTVTEARHLTAGVTPAFTGMRRCGGTAQEIINDGELYIKQVQQSQFSPMAAVLLHGPLGRCGWQRRRKGLSSLKKGGEEGRGGTSATTCADRVRAVAQAPPTRAKRRWRPCWREHRSIPSFASYRQRRSWATPSWPSAPPSTR